MTQINSTNIDSTQHSTSPRGGGLGGDVTHPARRWWALGFLATSVSLIVIDGTIVNVALPVMIHELGLSFGNAEWVTTVYALVFSVLLLLMGRVADKIGRRTVLLAGIGTFATGSLVAAFASSAGPLLVARAIQGVGGAAVLPTTLSTVNAVFRGRDRAIAFAVWGSVISGMAAVGPVLGGWIVTTFSWPWIFSINLPIAVVIVIGVWLTVPQTRAPHDEAPGLDVDGFLLTLVAMGGIVFGLIEGRTRGFVTPAAGLWEDRHQWPVSFAAVSLIVGVTALVLFVYWEYHRVKNGRSKILDLRLFGMRSFSLGNIAAMSIAIGEFGLLFVLPLYAQSVLGMTALQSGALLAAMAVGAFVSGAAARHIAEATSPATAASIGLGLEIPALLGLAFFGIGGGDTSAWKIVVWLVLYGIGLGIASAQLTSTVLADVPAAQSGQGAAVQSTVRQIGSALGIAIVATFLASSVGAAADGSLSEIPDLPAATATQLEKGLAQSAGSELVTLRHMTSDPQATKNPTIPSEEQLAELSVDSHNDILGTLSAAFAAGAARAIGLASGFILLGFLATLGLPRKNKWATDFSSKKKGE